MKKIITYLFLLAVNFSWAQLSFLESATAAGVDVSYGDSTYGGGVSFVDFDGDGWDDITFSSTNGEEVYFFKNNSGTFTLVDLGINDAYRTKQVMWVDYDNDGDKDFFATSITGFNKFYENDGSMNFTDITTTCGLFTDNLFTYGASFGDIENDGDLDVLISNRDDAGLNYNYLYRNDSGTFVEVTSAAGLNLSNELSFCSAFFDYNNDGYQDIYIANDKVANINRLYENDGDGTFTDVSVASFTGVYIDAMSTTIGDYNNDGWFDIYVTNTTAGNYHLRNNGNGMFSNVASSVGTLFESIAWGSVFLDADNDADLDLYVSSSMDGTVPDRLTAAFYENQGDDTYLIPTGIGFEFDRRKSFSNAIGDFNNDGYPDIIVMNDTEDNFLWKNTTSNSNNWLKVNLEGVASNKDGIGSLIEVNAGGKSQYKYTLSGEGYISQNSNTEFIGLGTATIVDYLKITWLSGTVDYFENVTVNQSLSIQEGESLSVQDYNLLDVQVFPNPTKDKLNINLRNHFETVGKIELYNLLGKIVLSETLNSQNTSLDISNQASGIYILKCFVEDKIMTKKVVIE